MILEREKKFFFCVYDFNESRQVREKKIEREDETEEEGETEEEEEEDLEQTALYDPSDFTI